MEDGPKVTPRWVGSGWTIFNNKGKPVQQFEPFFSATHNFEFGATFGVSPVLFYDPAERVIATLHPNHTFEKVVFDPWQQTTYDVNDTCAPRNAPTGDGDPRTDPDIHGYVEAYFETQPATWQTWYAQRIGGSLGQDEYNAAKRAEAHADTPTTAHFDPLGRPFLTVARNRLVCKGHDLDGTEDSVATRVELDIEGNQREIRDERKLPDVNYLPKGEVEQRIVARYAYDMLGNLIHQQSMDAGARWMLNDAAGKPTRAWDSRGHNFTTAYDELRRPLEQTVRGTTSDSDPRTLNRDILVDKIEYGEPQGDATPDQEAEAQRLNLRTRIYRHFDSAGVVTNARIDGNGKPTEAYDFKGNLQRSTRQLVSDYAGIPDWRRDQALETETFEAATRYDALNRPFQSIASHSSLVRPQHPNRMNVIQPVFNEANLLERVDVWLERAAEPPDLLDPNKEAPSPVVGVDSIDYDAKGQRLRIDYKNDASTSYSYDPQTFRLIHLYTRRGAAFTGDCVNTQPPPPTIAAPATPPRGKTCGVQNLRYTYDPAGNITHIQDDAQQTIYFRNQRIEPSNDYTYDALYRLIEATGREHLGQQPNGYRNPPTAPDGFNTFHTRQDQPNDLKAMGTYTERYVYDAVGNFLQLHHHGTDPEHPGWTRGCDYAEPSLIENGSAGAPIKNCNRLPRTILDPNGAQPPLVQRYRHDPHGNMVRMPHLDVDANEPNNMHWDYKDQLGQTDLGGGGTAFYVYDSSGQRVRKVWKKAPGMTEERIYLDGFEIFRRHSGRIGQNTATLERETLHVTEGTQRLAVVETRTLDLAGKDPAPQRLIRYQLANHLESAVLELDDRAEIISYEEYTPYGSTSYQAVRSQTETPKRYRYTGKERDEENGLYYHGARYYAPWLARWVSADPAGLADGPNMFVYARWNPLRNADRTGHQSGSGLKKFKWEPPTDQVPSTPSAEQVQAQKQKQMSRLAQDLVSDYFAKQMRAAPWYEIPDLAVESVKASFVVGLLVERPSRGPQAFGIEALWEWGSRQPSGAEAVARMDYGLDPGYSAPSREVFVEVGLIALPAVVRGGKGLLSRAVRAESRELGAEGRALAAPAVEAVIVDELDRKAEKAYKKIRQYSAADLADVARNTGFSQGQIKVVHGHLFMEEHEIPVGPKQVEKRLFSPDSEVAPLWTKARAGTLNEEEQVRFGRLMLHETTEWGLRSKGMPYRSADPRAWTAQGLVVTPQAYGAHDLAPNAGWPDPFRQWYILFDLGPPPEPPPVP